MADLRNRIIQEALFLFEKDGFHGVSVNQIVQKVGTSKGGFYHHFTSKDELLFVIHDTFITYVLDKAMIADGAYDSPTQKLEAIVKDFVKVFDLYKAHISVFYQENIYLKPEYESMIKKKRDHFKQIIIQTIHEGKESGDFRRDIPADITGMAILGMVNWTYKWYKRSGPKSIDEIGNIFVDFILRAILETNTYQNKARESFLPD
ncbi:TetR/AcrR family transcriptional regulator [Virgibacillus ihumii]|uniref:TetR/AcrR family transcriptional regulator n=1 Tax=Virgibacillus ihumii TaxID=2686091 RepID=UPI00157BC877|nr:TetR/AcrR family transcriptional regulator [Virgibacillus ihumii]